MHTNLSVRFFILVLLLTSLACGVSDAANPTPLSGPELETAVAQGLGETAAFQTSVAQAVVETEQVTWEARQTVIIEQTVTPATGNPLVSVSQVTNCRSGPGTNYDSLGSLGIGVQVEVFARDPYNTFFFIRNPNNPVEFCWIFGKNATLNGDTSKLPVFTPMPTPTLVTTSVPSGDFLIAVLVSSVCGAGTYQAQFQLTNNGTITWQSYRVVVTDHTTTVVNEISRNTFLELPGCTSVEFSDLAPGETGVIASADFTDYIAGHYMTAEITVCSLDNLSGTCMTKTVDFISPTP